MKKRGNLRKDICLSRNYFPYNQTVILSTCLVTVILPIESTKVVSQTRRNSASVHNAVIAIIYAELRGDWARCAIWCMLLKCSRDRGTLIVHASGNVHARIITRSIEILRSSADEWWCFFFLHEDYFTHLN